MTFEEKSKNILRALNAMMIKKNHNAQILERSNVIHYDIMGYPLRLCIVKVRKTVSQEWLDTIEEEGDVICKWTEV